LLLVENSPVRQGQETHTVEAIHHVTMIARNT